jgi:adenine-specific DNA-methyltransferase
MDKKNLQTEILEASYQPEKWLEVLKLYFGAKKFHQTPQQIFLPSNNLAEKAIEIGSFYTADERLIGIYEIQLTAKAWIDKNRVGLRNLLRQVYKYDVDGALIVFVQNDKWRFSYVSEIRTEEGKKETEPKRYTYLFGKGESCRTAADRFDKIKGKPIYINDLFDAFSVDKLNKDFFKSYKEFFESFSDHLAKQSNYRNILLGSPMELEKGWKDEQAKPIRDFAKKLLGRIVFLQFLQKKGWMGVPSSTVDWIGGDAKFLQNLFKSFPDKDHFHSKILKTLFFETLNSKRPNQLAPAAIGNNIKIPYLNGGLFDKDISFDNAIDFPADLFKNLLDFFEAYNFTIDENDPYDSEVGIDPEMLGHIFENLLEENREKGAFYTPKAIVHYMSQESLIQYLRTHLPECTEDDSPATKALENFIRNGNTGNRTDKKNFVVQQAKRIERLLDNVKICDPAIGSGAFPMGMLLEIFKAKTALDLTLDHAEVKKQIIQNCIYGVDIENGAVDIARLRFWLALVVDETEPHPLPNLDYKIMQGNSLLESFEGIDLSKVHAVSKNTTLYEPQKDIFGNVVDPQLKFTDVKVLQENNLQQLMLNFFNETDPEKKATLRQTINQTVHDHIDYNLELWEHSFERQLSEAPNSQTQGLKAVTKKRIEELNAQLETLKEKRKKLYGIQNAVNKPYFLWHLFFADVFEKGGFDIVIGNPPYVGQKGHKEMFQDIKNSSLGNKYHQRRMDLFYFFFHHGIILLKSKGILAFITTNYYLTATYADKLRKHIYGDTSIISLLNFNELKIFESALGQHNLITILKKGKFPELTAKTLITQKTGLANETIISNIINDEDADTEYNQQTQNQLFEKGTLYIRIESQLSNQKSGNGIYQILNKMRVDDTFLEKYCFIEQGIVSGSDKVSESHIKDYPQYNFTKGDGIYLLTKEELDNLNLDDNDYRFIKKTYKNSEIKKWWFKPKDTLFVIYLKSNGEYFEPPKKIKTHLDKFKIILINRNVRVGSITERDYDDFLNDRTDISYIMNASSMKKGNYYCLSYARREKLTFEKPKIVNSRRAHLNTFALEDSGYYEQSDMVITTLKPEYENQIDIRYFLAILNSKLIFTWFYFKGKRKGEQLELFQKPISEVPIKVADFEIQENIVTLTSEIIELKRSKIDSSLLENKIDALVFHLYGLTESEILQVLETFKDLSIKDRNQIQNEYWNIANNKFQLET